MWRPRTPLGAEPMRREPLLQRAGQGSEQASGVVQPDPEDPGAAKAREGAEASETRLGRPGGGRRLLDDAHHLGEALLGGGAEELERDVPGLPGRPPGPRNRQRGDRLLHRVLLHLGDLEGDEEAQHQRGSPSSHSRSWLRAYVQVRRRIISRPFTSRAPAIAPPPAVPRPPAVSPPPAVPRPPPSRNVQAASPPTHDSPTQ